MLAVERKNLIYAKLCENGRVLVNDLAEEFGVSDETIRRDLDKLEQEGLAEKFYGGAIKVENTFFDLPFHVRQNSNMPEKRKIAELCLPLIHDGDYIAIDSSTTALEIIKAAKSCKNLTVITNSQRVVDTLAPEARFKLICTGGEYVVRNMAYFGRIAERTMDHFCPDLAFFASKGVNERGEITDISEEETTMRVAAIKRATRSVFLCDKSKTGKTFPHHVAWMKDMDVIVTEADFPAEYLPRKA